MGILENIESAWDEIPIGQFENLYTKIFSNSVCKDCLLSKSVIDKAIKDGKSLFFRGILKDHQIPTWQEVIDDLSLSAKTPKKEDRPWAPKQHGRVDIYDDFKYISILPETTNIKMQHIKDFVMSLNNIGFLSYTTIISLTDSDPDTGPHYDDTHVFNFQLIGQSRWTIHHPDGPIEYFMNPGDFIFVPDGLVHEVKSLTPRVSLSIATMNEDKLDFYK